MQNFVLLFFSAVTGLFPINLDLKTFYSSEKEIPVERIYSQNFKENNYVNSFSKNGYLWIETDIPEDIKDRDLEIISISDDAINSAVLFVLDENQNWKWIGKTGHSLMLRDKAIPAISQAFELNGAQYRTESNRTVKIRLRVESSRESLIRVYTMSYKTYVLMNSMKNLLCALFIGVCISTIFFIVFICKTFNDYNSLCLAFACVLILILTGFRSAIFNTYITPGIVKPANLYRLINILLCGIAVLLQLEMQLSSKTIIKDTHKIIKKIYNYFPYFYISIGTIGILNLVLPLPYSYSKYLHIISLSTCFLVLIVQSVITIKYDPSCSREVIVFYNLSIGILWIRQIFTVTRFLEGTSAVFHLFDNTIIGSYAIPFFLIDRAIFIKISKRMRETLAFLQIKTAEAKEQTLTEKKRSYVYNTLASMLSNPLQIFTESYEQTKQYLSPEVSSAMNKTLQNTTRFIYSISALSTYQYDKEELEYDRDPIDLSQFVTDSISVELSTLRLNGSFPYIQEKYTDGTFVMANKSVLSVALRFILQTVINKSEPKSTVYITSEYENLTFIFSAQFKCSNMSGNLSNIILNLESDNENEAISTMVGVWGIQLHVAKQISNLLNGNVSLLPTSEGISIQLRVALKPFTPEEELLTYDYAEDFDDESEKEEIKPVVTPKYKQLVFIVEEEANVRTILQEKFKSLCYTRVFSTNQELTDYAEQEMPTLIIYSLTAPGLHLTELFAEHPLLNSIPFIVTTKYISRKTTEQLYKNGVLEIINKPFLSDLLLLKVESLLKSKQNYLDFIINAIKNNFKESVASLANPGIMKITGNQKISGLNETSSAEDTYPGNFPSEKEEIPAKKPASIEHEAVKLEATAVFTSAKLTKKEKDIAHLILEGKSDKEIAAELGISPGTVAVHNKKIYRKLGIHSRSELISKLPAINGNKDND